MCISISFYNYGFSSVGRALVSKTRCREFEPLNPCEAKVYRREVHIERSRNEPLNPCKAVESAKFKLGVWKYFEHVYKKIRWQELQIISKSLLKN